MSYLRHPGLTACMIQKLQSKATIEYCGHILHYINKLMSARKSFLPVLI